MGIINVEGIGKVQIQGDNPTQEEFEVIESAVLSYKEKKRKKLLETINITKSSSESVPPFLQIPKEKKTFTEGLTEGFTDRETTKAALSLGGFATGAATGTAVGGPIGGIVGGLGGAILGGTAGGQIHDIVSSYIDGNNLTLDETSKQAFKDIKSEAMWGAVGQSIPGLKPFITRTLLKKESGKLVADDIKQAHQASKRIGVDLFPVDVSGALGQMYAKVIGIFPWVGRPLKKPINKRADQLNKIQDQYLDDLAPNNSMSKLGVNMFEAAKNSSKSFRNMSSGLYTDFYESAAKIKKPFIPTITIKKEAQQIIKDYLKNRPKYVTVTKARGKKIKKKIAIPSAVNAKYATFIKRLAQIDDFATPSQIKQLKQDIGEYSKLVAGKDGAGVFRLTNLAESVEGALRNFKNYNLNAVSEKEAAEIIKKLKIADKFYANNIVKFTGSTAKRFQRAEKNIFSPGFKKSGSIEPDEIFQAVVRTSSPQSLKDLRFLIGDKNYKKVVAKVVDNAFSKSMVKSNEFRGLKFDPFKLEEELGLVGKKQSEKLFNMVKGTDINPQKLLDLIEISKLHANLQVPDVGSFLARRLTLGGYKSLIGGIFMGAGVVSNPFSTAVLIQLSRGGSKFFANPKNIDLAIDVLDASSPRLLKYKATIDLLSRTIRDTTDSEEKKFYKAMKDEFEENKDKMLETMSK